MVIRNLSLMAALSLSGCAVFQPLNDMIGLGDTLNNDEQTEEIVLSQNIDDGSPFNSSVNFQKQFSQKPQQIKSPLKIAEQKVTMRNGAQNAITFNKKHDIHYYVRGLMQDLVANLQYVNSTTPVAVVSFVMLNGDYNEANILGIQIAESLMHEVHKFGIPVIDFKTTGYIRITGQGDFAFSKDYEDFTGEMPARYIVGGTMLKNAEGYLINARIVGVKSQAIVASAQSFIPYSVSDPILTMSLATHSANEHKTGGVVFSSESSTVQNSSASNTSGNTSSSSVFLIQE